MNNRKTISAEVGERIRIFRTEQKLSQEELAFASDIHPAYVGKVERGEKCPTIETLLKIANGLKIPLHKLLDLSETTEIIENDAYYRIQSSLKGLNTEQIIRIAKIIEEITALMRDSV